MNSGVSKTQARRPRVKLSKALQEFFVDAVASTSAELPQSHRKQSPVNGTLTRDGAAVWATKRPLDEASEDLLPAKKARLTQEDAQQLGIEDEKAGRATEPKPTTPNGRYVSFLKDFVDPVPPSESVYTFVSEWLNSVEPDRDQRCRSDSHLQRPGDDPISRKLAKSAPEMSYTRDTDGFTVPLMPVSTGSRPYRLENDAGSVTPSDVTSTGRSSGRSLVEDPLYRDANLAENNIYMRPLREQFPEHIAGLVDYMRRDRSSPGPSPDQVSQDTGLNELWIGAGETEVEEYFRTNIFPYPVSESLKRCDRQPIAKHAVPNTGSKLRVSNPVPDMLYGYSRHGAFTRAQQIQFNSMGNAMVANGQNLIYPFFVIEFKGDGPTGGGTMWVATNQCLGGSSSCVNIAERLNHQLRECKSEKIQPINSTAFSIAMSGTEARLYISWKHNELDYYMANVKSFLLQDPKHYIEFRKYVRNIIDWGKDKRLKDIQNCLDSLLEESRKRTSEAAKSHQPPSDDSAAGSGKKPRSSSSRKNSSRSSTARGRGRGSNGPHWQLDRTESQGAYGATPSYPGQQQSFIDAGNYIASQDVDEGHALPAYLYEVDNQQGQSQPLLDSSTEAAASFVTSPASGFSSSLTSSFSVHGHKARSKHPRDSRSSPMASHGSKQHGLAKGQTSPTLAEFSTQTASTASAEEQPSAATDDY
ncbi:hypothetical protein MMYC01_200195 [Madurella mycetomatis]|uniref:DUF7924 domain-containing protein n=1 Tax=Madurella mycetomatis TaxID=100816 RepID=A0A175WKD7_9PEZI|nr:hypothetical protein MMYC01_200195 [Madurella mycetomatis]